MKKIVSLKYLSFEGKIKGGIEVRGRRGRRRRKLLDDLKERRGYSNLNEEALERTIWRARLEEALELSQDRLLNGECEFCLQEVKFSQTDTQT